jgi:hypothetical protein
MKRNYLEFEFKPHQANDSSQSNQETNYLVSQSTFPSTYLGLPLHIRKPLDHI